MRPACATFKLYWRDGRVFFLLKDVPSLGVLMKLLEDTFKNDSPKSLICVQLGWDLLTATSFPYSSNDSVNTMLSMQVEVTPRRLDLFHNGWMDTQGSFVLALHFLVCIHLCLSEETSGPNHTNKLSPRATYCDVSILINSGFSLNFSALYA